MIRFALIGCGGIAPTHARALAELPGEAALAAVVDLDEARAAAFGAEWKAPVRSWTEVLADPAIDAVAICTPSGLHAELAIAAMRAGKHAIVEKPMDVSVAACRAVVAAERETGRTFGCISQHRFDPAAERVAALVAAGCLGRIVGVEARVPWYRTQAYYDSAGWRGTWALDGGGALMNQGVHTVDLMLGFAGPVERVFARFGQPVHERIEVEDHVVATVEFASGAVGTFLASTSIRPGFPASVGLFGSEGTAMLEGDDLRELHVPGEPPISGGVAHAHARQVATGGTAAATAAVGHDATAWTWGCAHREQFRDFVRACATGGRPRVGSAEGLAAVAFVQAVYRSARSGRPEVPERA